MAGEAAGWRLDLARAWHRHRWLILSTLVAVGLVLGFIGWNKQQPDYGWVDVLYADLKLTSIRGGPATTTNNFLGIARFLVPFAIGFTALLAFLEALGDRVRTARAGFLKGHVVVVGGGDKGAAFAQAARDAGDDVIVVDLGPDDRALDRFRAQGVYLVKGDAREPALLAEAGVDRARELIVVGPGDEVNAEVAKNAIQASIGRPPSSLRCLVHVANGDVAVLLRRQQFRQAGALAAEIDFFSLETSAASLLYDRFPPADDELEERTVWLAGVDAVWDSFLGLLAGTDADLGRRQGSTEVVVVDADAEHAVEQQAWKLAAFGPQLRLEPVAVRPGEARRSALPEADPTVVYVRLGDDDETVKAALHLRGELADHVPVVACLTRQWPVTVLVGDGMDNLQVVSLVPDLCRRDRIDDALLETMARAFHEHYLAERLAEGKPLGDDEALVPWTRLAPSFKESNRDLARDINRKLGMVGCELVPSRVGDTGGFTFTDDEVDGLGPVEHERWVNERTRAGWTYEAGPKDERRKVSPYLVPWSQVPPDIKEYDRQAVRAIPDVLARVGLRIVRTR